MNKRYFFNLLKTLLLLLTVSGASGCNDWLDVRPENEQPIDEFWNNKEEVDAVMMGAYQQLRSSLEYLVRWGELRGDVVELGPHGDDTTSMFTRDPFPQFPHTMLCRHCGLVTFPCNLIEKSKKDLK